jgi:microcystin-dependent protein
VSAPFIGQISIMSFAFAPKGWALCNGQILPINQNQALFSLLGTNYGGNGQTNFALPDLQGRAPVHLGGEVQLGRSSGEENHTLLGSEVPTHAHLVQGTANQSSMTTAGGNVLAEKPRRGKNIFGLQPVGNDIQPLDASSITVVGGSQPHSNMQPFLVLNFVIALTGIFPSRN